MKKLTILFTAIILFASCTQTKIGYVDIEEIMKDYDATEIMEAQLKAEQEQMSKSLDSIMLPFQAKVQVYYQNIDKMSATDKTTQETELQQEQQAIQAQQQQAQQFLQLRSQQEIEALTKVIDSTVEAYAITNKFQMILGTQGRGTVMYGEDQINLTETIVDILNAELE